MVSRTRVIASLCLSVGGLVGCAESPISGPGEQTRAGDETAVKSADANGGLSDSEAGSDTLWPGRTEGAAPAANEPTTDAAEPLTASESAVDAGVAAPRDTALREPTAATPSSQAGATSARDAGRTAALQSDGGAAVTSTPELPGTSAEDCQVPDEAALEDVSHPTTVVGSGTPASCTSSAFVAAVAQGGVVTFDCGAEPVTITLDETAKVFNDRSEKVVIDGGGKVTLSGGNRVRILYQNTCDEAQVWTTPHCDNQPYPELTVQNLTFVDGQANDALGGGGAIYAQGGRLKVVDSHFYGNGCAETGATVAGGALRAFQQYDGLPVHIVGSTFGDEGRGNVCSNGGAVAGLSVSFQVWNSVLNHNEALGMGGHPARDGTPGGGRGGALYADGDGFDASVCGSTLEGNRANEPGAAIFFMSSDRSGLLRLTNTVVQNNVSPAVETHPGLFAVGRADPVLVNTVVR